MIFLKPETLDKLAEDILIASRQTFEADGYHRTNHGLPIREAPEAVRILLNHVFGGPQNWQVLGGWPRPEQTQPAQWPPEIAELMKATAS